MISALALLWERPLGLASRSLFLAVRAVLRRIVTYKLRRGRETSRWQLLSGELLQRRFALPVVMTEGPRWNTHAAIGRVGPLDVSASLAIDV